MTIETRVENLHLLTIALSLTLENIQTVMTRAHALPVGSKEEKKEYLAGILIATRRFPPRAAFVFAELVFSDWLAVGDEVEEQMAKAAQKALLGLGATDVQH